MEKNNPFGTPSRLGVVPGVSLPELVTLRICSPVLSSYAVSQPVPPRRPAAVAPHGTVRRQQRPKAVRRDFQVGGPRLHRGARPASGRVCHRAAVSLAIVRPICTHRATCRGTRRARPVAIALPVAMLGRATRRPDCRATRPGTCLACHVTGRALTSSRYWSRSRPLELRMNQPSHAASRETSRETSCYGTRAIHRASHGTAGQQAAGAKRGVMASTKADMI